MKHILFVLSFAALLGCTSSSSDAPAPEPTSSQTVAPATVKTIPDSKIGLAPGTAFEQPGQEAIRFNTVDPGDGLIQPRPNAEFPPVIPHSVQDMGPISIDENPCLECHAADAAEDVGAVAVPPSHRMDLRNSPGEVGQAVTGARLVCTSCHVAMTG